jgi:hypothetical protein
MGEGYTLRLTRSGYKEFMRKSLDLGISNNQCSMVNEQ